VIVNLALEASNLDQTGESAVDIMVVVGDLIYMNEPSVYIIEQDAWSTVKQCHAHFRLTYKREFYRFKISGRIFWSIPKKPV
jgi:hypothetical protein